MTMHSPTSPVRSARRRISLLALAAGLACSDASAPGLDGPSYFTITVDGQAWAPDTVTGVFFAVTPDSGTLNLFATRAGPVVTETVVLTMQLPLASRSLQLTGTPGTAVGTYFREPGSPPSPTGPPAWRSTDSNPGSLQITGFSAADTVIAGAFAFQAVATPDTAGHHTLRGRFRVRYFTQQVYLPAPPVDEQSPLTAP